MKVEEPKVERIAWKHDPCVPEIRQQWWPNKREGMMF
jgi:hypothetical protein